MRFSISSGGRPLYDQITDSTGISMFGKISVGVRMIVSGPTIRSSKASTTNVYGRRSASRTIHMERREVGGVGRKPGWLSRTSSEPGGERCANGGWVRHARREYNAYRSPQVRFWDTSATTFMMDLLRGVTSQGFVSGCVGARGQGALTGRPYFPLSPVLQNGNNASYDPRITRC